MNFKAVGWRSRHLRGKAMVKKPSGINKAGGLSGHLREAAMVDNSELLICAENAKLDDNRISRYCSIQLLQHIKGFEPALLLAANCGIQSRIEGHTALKMDTVTVSILELKFDS